MKKIILICLLTVLTTSTAYARGSNSPWYVGVIGGFMDAGNGIADDAINGGFDLGYKFNRYVAGEVELTSTFIDGETRNGNDWEVDTTSFFVAFRSNTEVKLKGKIGITNIDTGNNDDTELSLGIGVAFWALGGLTEIEYTNISDDYELDFLSFGVKYFF